MSINLFFVLQLFSLYFLDLISIQFRLETILFLQIHVQQIHVQMTDLAWKTQLFSFVNVLGISLENTANMVIISICRIPNISLQSNPLRNISLSIFTKITGFSGFCNDTSECTPREFCSDNGTKLGESKGICKIGNIQVIIRSKCWVLYLCIKWIYWNVGCRCFYFSNHWQLRWVLDARAREAISALLQEEW